MNKDLRSFIGEARQLGSTYYAGVSEPLDPIFEPCVIQQKLAVEGRYPIIRCNHINGSNLPLVTNIFGSYRMPSECGTLLIRTFDFSSNHDFSIFSYFESLSNLSSSTRRESFFAFFDTSGMHYDFLVSDFPFALWCLRMASPNLIV